MENNKLETFHPMGDRIGWFEKRLKQAEAVQESQREIIEGQRNVLATIQRVSELHHTDLDTDDVLDILCKEIVELGCFRSLMMALVDAQRETVGVVRNFVYTNLDQHTQKTPSSVLVKRPLPHQVTYALDDENITAHTVRAQTCQIVEDRTDARLDQKIEQDIKWTDKIAYFIPIRQGGNDVVGVVATGSLRAEKEEVLKQIDMMQPALNIVGTLIESIYCHSVQEAPSQSHIEALDCLSKREQEILKAIALDYSNKEIADQLALSVRTVETYRRNMMKKLDINSVVGLVKFAIKHGLINI